MITNDEGIISLKHKVMEEVCRLAWDNNLNEETREQLVYRIIPGPNRNFAVVSIKKEKLSDREYGLPADRIHWNIRIPETLFR